MPVSWVKCRAKDRIGHGKQRGSGGVGPQTRIPTADSWSKPFDVICVAFWSAIACNTLKLLALI